MFERGDTIHNMSVRDSPIRAYVLVLLTFASVFFSRLLTTMGAPGLVNFLHFALVPILFVILCYKVSPKLRPILVGMGVLLVAIVFSALMNGAGFVNVVLDFLLLAEPFLLLAAMVNIPWSLSSVRHFRHWLLLFIVVDVLLAYFQRFALGFVDDGVTGVFGENGAHTAAAVAFIGGIYFFARLTELSVILRVTIALSWAAVIIFADAKQVIVAVLAALVVLAIIKWKHFSSTLRYVALLGVGIVITVWLASTIFPALTNWADASKIRDGLEQKLQVFSIFASFYHLPFNWVFGLGPGHTVGRLAIMLPDYYQYFQPLGATTSPATQEVLTTSQASYVTNSTTGSSMWSLQFSWAGIWGDLGLLGVGTYFCLWWLVWRNLASTDFSRFLLVIILVFGAIFFWLEDPGFMLFIVSLIGLEWQEHQNKVSTLANERAAKRMVKRSYVAEALKRSG